MLREIDGSQLQINNPGDITERIFSDRSTDLAPQTGTTGYPLALFERIDPLGVWVEESETHSAE